MIWLLLHPLTFSPQQVVSFSQSSCVLAVELTDGREGGGGGGGAKSYDSEKTWSSINHAIHSKKRLAVFPSPAGMTLTKLSLAGNY